MKKMILALIVLSLIIACSPFRVKYVSPEIKNKIKEPFLLKVSSEPQMLESELRSLGQRKLSLIATLVDAQEIGTIEIKFKTKQQLTTDKDGKTIFATTTEILPRQRHIFQSSEMEFAIYDEGKNLVYKSVYKYEGKNDYKVGYLQTPEEAMEECLDRILEKLKRDLK